MLLTRRWAFKLPSLVNGWRCFLRGLLANQQEAEWHRVSLKLCPIRLAIPGGWLNVMPRCEPLSEAEWVEIDAEAFILDGDLRLPVEQKRCSFGRLGGAIVAVDFG